MKFWIRNSTSKLDFFDSSRLLLHTYIAKGGLFSETFSLWLKSPNKGAKSLMNTFFFVQSAQENDLTPYLGDLSQWERLSEIKLALLKFFRYLFSELNLRRL